VTSPIDGGVVMITGASSGIGLEMARVVAPRCRRLVLVARREERLTALRDELLKLRPDLSVTVRLCDLSDASQTASLAAECGDLDVLINNAGVGDMSLFERADETRLCAMMELNMTSLVRLTRAALPGMLARKRGGILNVSSGFGLSYLPGFAVYVGTKHFVTGFTESLRAELRGTGVTVTQVCPGPVATEFEQNIGNFTGHKAPSLIEISAARCAKVAIRGLDRKRGMVVPGLAVGLSLLLVQFTPRPVVRWVVALLGGALRRAQDQTAGRASA
jgi:hypothetical protein